MPLVSGLLSIGPRICKDDGKLIATTGWRFGLLTLGTMLRRVEVDVAPQTVRIHSRYLWLFKNAAEQSASAISRLSPTATVIGRPTAFFLCARRNRRVFDGASAAR